jgi:hypothetical protein
MSKQILLNFNSKIKSLFKDYNIPIHDGISYLLSVHYGVKPSYIPAELERRVLATNIITMDYSNNLVKWNESLFEETEIGFEWVSDWMDLFRQVNPERRGTKADVLRRMKKFFVNNPSIRKDDVFEATKAYLASVSNPIYCKKSHKFIYEIDGTSMLLDYVQQTIATNEYNSYNSDVI